MGIRAFRWHSVAFLGLLAGVGGCEDRLRPILDGVGNGIGPLSLVTAPAELATVTRGVNFTVGIRVEDGDGVDSVWVIPSDTLMEALVLDGEGRDVVSASYTPAVTNSYLPDTLVISVHGIDLLGDTGVVYTRRLLVQ